MKKYETLIEILGKEIEKATNIRIHIKEEFMCGKVIYTATFYKVLDNNNVEYLFIKFYEDLRDLYYYLEGYSSGIKEKQNERKEEI